MHKNSKSYDFKDSLELFIDDCKLRNLRSHSIRYYSNELKVFERYLEDQDLEPMTKEEVDAIDITIDKADTPSKEDEHLEEYQLV